MDLEEALVRRSRSGDRGAFEDLVRRTTRLVYARLYLETGDRELAEDLLQETYLRAFRPIRQVSEPAGFRRWLLAIAQTVAIDAFRRSHALRRSAPRRESQEVLGETPAPPPEDPERAQMRERVRTLLQSLPDEYRLPLMLRYIDGADYATITVQLGLSAGSLRGLLNRGLVELRRTVKSEVSHESR